MSKINQISLLIIWSVISVCSAQETGGAAEGLIPIDNLSRENPNHKRIFEWLDNYRQKASEMSSYQTRDQIESSKLDLVNPQSYSSINDAIKLASNQPQQQSVDEKALPKNFEDILRITSQQENEKQQSLNKRALNQLLPAAFNQVNSQNQQPQHQTQVQPGQINLQQLQPAQAPPIDLQGIFAQARSEDRNNLQLQPAQTPPLDLQGLFAHGRPEERNKHTISKVENLDPFIQEHIRKLAEQSLSDGRTVLVEVKGDDTSDKSILEQLRPMLHDPSVLDQLRPRLQESKSLLRNPNPVQLEPIYVEHKKSELQSDKPLLEQRERIDKLRNILIEQQGGLPQQQKQWVPLQAQPQHLTQIPQLTLPSPQPQNIWVQPNQRALMQQLEALAVRPLVNQFHSPVPQSLPPPPQNAQLIAQQPYNLGKPEIQLQSSPNTVPKNPEPQLIGQRLRQSPSSQQPQLVQHTSWNQHGASIDEQDAKQDNRAKRQGQYEQNGDYISSDPLEESRRRKQLRDDLIRSLEEQERKRQELIQIDQQHRDMIAEERRKQEIRDQQDAERKILEQRNQKPGKEQNGRNRQRKPGPQKPAQPTQSPLLEPRNIVSDQRWSSQDWEQTQPQTQPQQQQHYQPLSQAHHKPEPLPQPQVQHQFHAQLQARDKPEPLPQAQAQHQFHSQPHIREQPQPRPQPQPQPQYVEINSKLVDGDRAGPTGPVDVLHSIQYAPLPQTATQVPAPRPIHSSPELQQPLLPTNTQNNNNQWIAIEAALNQLQQSEKQSLTQQSRAPIQVSAQALAQAEAADAEYIKLLREILMSQLQQNQPQQEPNPKYVPVEAPPVRGQLTTTLPSGQVLDGNDTNWWRSDNSRSSADPNSRQ